MSFQKVYGLYDLNRYIVDKRQVGCDFSVFSWSGGSGIVLGEWSVGLRVVGGISFHKGLFVWLKTS